MVRSCVLAAALAFATLSGAAPLTRLRDVRELPRTALSSNLAVHVRGLITCVNPHFNMLFVQDETAGVFLYRYSPTVDLAPGDEVEVQGYVAKGKFSPILDSAQITVLGKKSLPVPPHVPIGRAITGELDGERVELQGIVQRASRRGDHLWLHLAAGENSCAVGVPLHSGSEVPDLVDTVVRVRGVMASAFRQDALSGFQMFANGSEDVEALERPAVNAFALPVCPAAELTLFRGRRFGEHRVHVRGVVTLHWPGRATVIQDSTDAIFIENGAAGDLKVGDSVDAAGFIVLVGTGNRLRHAEVRPLGKLSEPQPASATLANAFAMENQLVRLVGRIVEWQPHRDGETLALLSSGSDLFTAVIRDAGAERARALFAPGAMLTLTGVMRPATEMPGGRPAIWLRTPADISLLHAAPRSPWFWVGVAGVVLAGILVAGTAVITGLVARHRRATAVVNARYREGELRLEEMERQFRRSHRDGELIVQELHDNIVQSIFSVGLGIDEARRLAQKSPERVEERLEVAVQALNKVIRDVRAFIGGLEPKGLEGDELKTALKSVLLTSGEDQEARFSLQIDASAARELTSMQATEVFNIAKEAMTNSMRHAQARLTTVSLVPRGRGVRLEVADDGVGFDPERVSEHSLGLHNLRNRARNIGATLEVISAPGRGTRIVADIPILTHDNN
jgi:signal transduction histidine kinase